MHLNQLDETSYFYSDTFRPVLSGFTGEFSANTRVYLDIGGKQYLAEHDPVTGRYSWTPDFDITDGTYSFSIRVVDGAGNSSKPLLRTLIVDTTPPEAPQLLNLYDDVPPVEGSFDPGQSIDDPRPTMKGIAQPDTVIYLRNEKNETIGSARVDKNGYWEVEPDRDLAVGKHTLHLVVVEDFGGKLREGASGEAFSFVVTPVEQREARIDHASDDVGAVQGRLNNGDVTDDTTPTLHGTGAANSTITLRYRSFSGAWNTKTLTSDNDGNWQFTPSPALADNAHIFQVKQSNGSWGNQFVLYVETSSDTVPTIDYAEDNVGPVQTDLLNGSRTDDTTPTLHGSGPAAASIYVRFRLDNGEWTTRSVTSDQFGIWAYTPSPALGNGSYTFQVQLPGGRWSEDFVLEIDTSMDARASIAWATDDVGPVQGNLNSGSVTDDTTPTLHGFGPGSSSLNVRYRAGSGSWATRRILTDENGNWQFTPSPPLGNGKYTFQVQKPGESWSSDFTLTVDTSSGTPHTPHIVDAYDDVGSYVGPISHNGTTDDSKPVIRGTGHPGEVIYVEYNLSNQAYYPVGSTIVGADGKWSIESVELAHSGTWDWRAKAIVNGKESDWSNDFWVHYVAPAGAVINYAYDNEGAVQGSLSSGSSTDDTTPTLYGSATANASLIVRYRLDSGAWITKNLTADSAGNWSWTPPTLANGNYTFQVQKAGGSWSSDFTLTIDTYLDKPVSIDYAWDNVGPVQGKLEYGSVTDDNTPTLYGSAPANASLSLRYKHGTSGWITKTLLADSAGNWSWAAPTLLDAVYSFQVKKSSDVSWGENFVLIIATTPTEPHTPVIVDAYDDVGNVTGPVKHNGTTDDSKPVIRGTGQPGDIIYVEYNLSNQKYYPVGSTVVGSDGKWSIESVELAHSGTWDWRAKALRNGKETGWGNDFWVHYQAPAEALIDYAYDNVGKKMGDLASGAITDDTTPTLHGSGPAYATLNLQYRSSGGSWTNVVVKTNANGDWEWTPTSPLATGKWEFHVKNSTDSNYGKSFDLTISSTPPNYSAIWDVENGSASLLAQFSGYISSPKFVKFNDKAYLIGSGNSSYRSLSHYQGNDLPPEFGNNALKLSWQKAYGESLYLGMSLYSEVHPKKLIQDQIFNFGLDLYLPEAPNGRGTYHFIATGHDKNGHEVSAFLHWQLVKGVNHIRFEDLSKLTGIYHVGTVAIEFKPYGYGKPYFDGAIIDNLSIDYTGLTNQSGKSSLKSLMHHDDVPADQFNDHDNAQAANKPVKGIFDLHETYLLSQENNQTESLKITDGKLLLNVNDILQHGEQGLFSDDGKTQLVIAGDQNDVVKLASILPKGSDITDWVEQQGNITVAGVEYQVFTHNKEEAELLVQQGVKTEFI